MYAEQLRMAAADADEVSKARLAAARSSAELDSARIELAMIQKQLDERSSQVWKCTTFLMTFELNIHNHAW